MARAEFGLFHQGNNFSQSLISRGSLRIKNRVGQHQPDLSQIEIKWGKLPFRVVAAITVAYLGLYACNPFKSYDAHAAQAERTPISLKSKGTPTLEIDVPQTMAAVNCLQITLDEVRSYFPNGGVAAVDLGDLKSNPYFAKSSAEAELAVNTDPQLELVGCKVQNGVFDRKNPAMITPAKLQIQNLQNITNRP